MENYVACQVLWHTKTNQYVDVGERVDLSHLSAAEVQLLVANGAVIVDREADASREKEMRESGKLNKVKGG